MNDRQARHRLSRPQAQRRTLVAGAVLAPLLAACGGGSDSGDGGSATTGTLPDGTPSYGGGKTPGSVTMVIRDRVTFTVTMPDISGVVFSSLTLDQFNALPLATRTINIGLDRTNAPLSTANFLSYVKSGAYVNTIFHRVIGGFVSQGGGFTADSAGTKTAIATTGTVPLESRNGLSNTRGTIAMARQDDPNSGSSQFYFNLVNNGRVAFGDTVITPGLDYQSPASPGYAVFGIVMDDASLAVLTDMNTIAGRASDGSGVLLRNFTITAAVQTA